MVMKHKCGGDLGTGDSNGDGGGDGGGDGVKGWWLCV